MEPCGISRRDVLRGVAASVAGGALPGTAGTVRAGARPATLPSLSPRASSGFIDPKAKSVVADIRAAEVIQGNQFHESLLSEMIEEGVRLATRSKTAGEAWNALLKPDDVIGIKFNHVGEELLRTTPAMARALVRSLGRAGFAPERIMLIEAPPQSTRELGTRAPVFGWSGGEVDFGSGQEQLAAVLQEVTAIINVPFLKTHNLAGMTGCLKNLSHALIRRPARYHANGCAPFVGDIVALPAVASKLRIHVVNAIHAVFDGGPAPTLHTIWAHSGVVVSRDPVAADSVGLDILNAQRVKAGLKRIGDADGQVAHVKAAAARNLGTNDQDYIELLRPNLF